MKVLHSIFLLALCTLWSCSPASTEVFSPDGKVRLVFAMTEDNHMTYSVDVNQLSFISSSELGLDARDGINLSQNMKVKDVVFDSADETWTQPWGENKTIRNHYNEMAVHLSDAANTKLTLRFRVFDDGVGFRYEYEVSGADSILVTDELTAFNIAQDGTSWSIPANSETYELLYRTQPVSQIDNANTPMTSRQAACTPASTKPR